MLTTLEKLHLNDSTLIEGILIFVIVIILLCLMFVCILISTNTIKSSTKNRIIAGVVGCWVIPTIGLIAYDIY